MRRIAKIVFFLPLIISCGNQCASTTTAGSPNAQKAYKNFCTASGASTFKNNPYNNCSYKCSNGSFPNGSTCSDGTRPTYSCTNTQNRCADGQAPDYNGICSDGYCANGRAPSYRYGQPSCY